MCFKFQVDLFRIIIDGRICTRHFFDYEISVNILVANDFPVIIMIEIRIADAKGREINIARFSAYSLVVSIATVFNCEGCGINFVHFKVEYRARYTGRNCRRILICKFLSDLNSLFDICLIVPVMEIEVPFSF